MKTALESGFSRTDLPPHRGTEAPSFCASARVRLRRERRRDGFSPHTAPPRIHFEPMKIVIYQKPTCSTCRQVHAALVQSGVDFDAVDYYVDPIQKKKLLDLLRKMRSDSKRSSRVRGSLCVESLTADLLRANPTWQTVEITEQAIDLHDQCPVVERRKAARQLSERRPSCARAPWT
jgi:glutaredoxin